MSKHLTPSLECKQNKQALEILKSLQARKIFWKHKILSVYHRIVFNRFQLIIRFNQSE